MTTKTVSIVQDCGGKHGGNYFLKAIYGDGTTKNFLTLPSKAAKILEAEGYKMEKLNYFEYIGIKEEA